jgi:hypothetical protein
MEKEFIIKHLMYYEIPCYDIMFSNGVLQVICGADFLEAWQKVLSTTLPKHKLTVHEIYWPYLDNDGIVKYDLCYSILAQ